jgi:CubicO group peptidase (beta-lactamase class C family)
MKKLFLLLMIVFLFLGFSTRENDPKKQKIEEITAQLVSEVSKDNTGSVAITILEGNTISYFKSFGPINKYNKFLPDTNTIFRIGSVSKSFAALLMMKLVEEGYFKLDDAIEKYLPEVKLLKGYSDSTKITFRQLASHTAGLSRTSNHVETETKGAALDWEKKTLSAIPHTKFILKPNTKMSYSNIGYAILGLAISRAANAPYIQLMSEKILKPLNMENTFFEVPESKMKSMADGTCDCGALRHKSTRVPKRMHKGVGYDLPAGGMYSTSSDIAKFVTVLMGTSQQKIISESSLATMQTGVMKFDAAIRRTFKNVDYGLGIVVYHLDNNITVLSKSGSIEGYWTTYAFDKKKNKAVMIMLNYDKHLDNEGTVVKMLEQL